MTRASEASTAAAQESTLNSTSATRTAGVNAATSMNPSRISYLPKVDKGTVPLSTFRYRPAADAGQPLDLAHGQACVLKVKE